MPSQFLKDRYHEFFSEVAGEETIDYYVFDGSSVNGRTGDVDESTAYAEDLIKISALVNFSPSKASREKIGLEIQFEAIVKITIDELTTKNNIDPKIGDAMVLPGDDNKFYIQKILRDRQHRNQHLDFVFAVSRNIGRRG